MKTKRGIDSERIRFKNYLIRTTGTSKNREFFENISLPISCLEARTPEWYCFYFGISRRITTRTYKNSTSW
ncbi:hypothetical protein AYB33_07740 [Leptospira santarosai]|nr:hypothetical protein LEP1GSC071_3903 [Leptospira santarosai str. JET]KXZ25901.1 hypothetical protein AYB33_07740 [Leptospira santarosai]